MNDYFLLVLMLLLIVLLGIGLLKAARWSRKNNMALKAKQEDSQEHALRVLKDELKRGCTWDDLKVALINFHSSSISKPEAFIGKALAIGVILFFVFLALLVWYFVWVRA